MSVKSNHFPSRAMACGFWGFGYALRSIQNPGIWDLFLSWHSVVVRGLIKRDSAPVSRQSHSHGRACVQQRQQGHEEATSSQETSSLGSNVPPRQTSSNTIKAVCTRGTQSLKEVPHPRNRNLLRKEGAAGDLTSQTFGPKNCLLCRPSTTETKP